jgi:hypothetical protein
MMYFKIGPGRFIEYDEKTERATIITREELTAQKQELIRRIGEPDPNMPTTNAGWIAWAKAQYPYMDHSAEQAELDRVTAVIAAIKDL